MPEDAFTLLKEGDITTLTLTMKNFIHDDNEAFMKGFEKVIDDGHTKIVMDASQTYYISSLILASMVYMLKKIQDKGGKLVLCNVKDRVKEVMEITNLHRVFDIVETKEQAVAKLMKK